MLQVGKVYEIKGKNVLIESGCYESGGRVSNYWDGRYIMEDGTLGAEWHGYADRFKQVDAIVEREPLSYRVPSNSRPGEHHLVRLNHLLDSAGVEYNCECDCMDFSTRCGPRFKKTGKISLSTHKDSRTRCRHIRPALREFSRIMVLTISRDRVRRNVEQRGKQ